MLQRLVEIENPYSTDDGSTLRAWEDVDFTKKYSTVISLANDMKNIDPKRWMFDNYRIYSFHEAEKSIQVDCLAFSEEKTYVPKWAPSHKMLTNDD